MQCFKTYDIRCIVPDEFNTEIARHIAKILSQNIKHVVIGHDARKTGPLIADILSNTFVEYGVNVIILPYCGTEEIYFESQTNKFDLGIMVTASHNPKEYNGLKFILKDGYPFTAQMLQDLRKSNHTILPKQTKGWSFVKDNRLQYISFLKKLTGFDEPRHKIVVNCGNGTAGRLLQSLGFILLNETPDGEFPNGIPNPMLPEMREETSKAVLEHNADFGVAFDGDFDRCFFFDGDGNFVSGYYSGGVLVDLFLQEQIKKERVVFDKRLYWNTLDILKKYNTHPVSSKTGHVFMKETMRKYDAIMGFEISGHHYFRHFAYCDSGIIPLLWMDKINAPLAELVEPMKKKYPCSEEINFSIKKSWNPFKRDVFKRVLRKYNHEYKSDVSMTDGLGIEFSDWRFNLRKSNTEPLVRLNIESRGDIDLVQEKVDEISKIIQEN